MFELPLSLPMLLMYVFIYIKDPKLEKEGRSGGTVSWDIYKSFFVSGGHWCKILTLFIIFICSQGLGSVADYFLTIW